MKKVVFNQIKKKIPKISATEMIALRSGSVSIDKDILSGKISFPKRFQYETKCDTVDSLLKEFDHGRIFPNDNQNFWINKVAKEKYFSFYGYYVYIFCLVQRCPLHCFHRTNDWKQIGT